MPEGTDLHFRILVFEQDGKFASRLETAEGKLILQSGFQYRTKEAARLGSERILDKLLEMLEEKAAQVFGEKG